MAILTENNNEYEIKVINAATKQPFREYVKLGDRESQGDSICERYIVAQPGAQFQVEVTLLAGFCFKSFNEVEVHLFFGNGRDHCAGHIFKDDDPRFVRTQRDYKATIKCVNMSIYGQRNLGAPFIFSSLEADEKLANETDIIGVNPADIGHFYVEVYRRKLEGTGAVVSLQPPTNLWDAKKVDQLNFKKHGITNSVRLCKNRIPTVGCGVRDYVHTKSTSLWFQFKYRTSEFLDHLDIVPYPPPLYYSPWKSLAPMERQWALKELQGLSKLQAQSAVNNAPPIAREPKEWRSWNDMQPSEREHVFRYLQEENKEFERGVVKQQLSELPANKFVILDDGDTVPRLAKLEALASIERERQGPQSVIKQEPINLRGPSAQQTQRETAIKRESIELLAFPSGLTSMDQELSAKRRKVHQESIDLNAIKHTKIKQEVMDSDESADVSIVFKKEPTIEHDLEEKKEANPTALHQVPTVKVEDFDHLDTAQNNVVPLSTAEVERIREEQRLAEEERLRGEAAFDEMTKEMEAETANTQSRLAELMRMAENM